MNIEQQQGENCVHYGHCGGCTLRHISYEEQLKTKIDLLQNAISAAAHDKSLCGTPEINVHPSPPDSYRDRVQFHRKEMRRGCVPGFMARNSNEVIAINDCLVLNDTLRAALRDGRITPPIEGDRWTIYGRDGLIVSENCGFDRQRGRFSLNAGGIEESLIIDAGCFFQCNSIMLSKLISKLMLIANNLAQSVGTNELKAADFYSGVGTFSIFMRRIFKNIDILEGRREAISIARENLFSAEKGTQRIRFFALSDSEWVKQAEKSNSKSLNYDFICIDPGRAGLHSSMRRWLCLQKKSLIAYISCEPNSLIRDSRELFGAGFSLVSIDLFDFYPQTERIETLAVFKV